MESPHTKKRTLEKFFSFFFPPRKGIVFTYSHYVQLRLSYFAEHSADGLSDCFEPYSPTQRKRLQISKILAWQVYVTGQSLTVYLPFRMPYMTNPSDRQWLKRR